MAWLASASPTAVRRVFGFVKRRQSECTLGSPATASPAGTKGAHGEFSLSKPSNKTAHEDVYINIVFFLEKICMCISIIIYLCMIVYEEYPLVI